MRNLKRVLSLGLASVMLLGMTVVGAGAASKDFTDSSEIKKAEAVDVVTMLGIMEGTDKGTFNPNGILTREQAAKIITVMLLGEDADKVTTNSVAFSDVAADRWSAGYIGYCAQAGILVGDGTGKFNPEGELTGLSFAKMLLVALGYDPAIEKYVGNDWAVNVAAGAVNAKVAPKGLVLPDALTRENAAQMAFQALTADMVYYTNKGTEIVNSDGSKIVIGASAPTKVSNNKADDYRVNKNDQDEYMQFCEKYFEDLSKNSGKDNTNDYGAPSVDWKYNKETVTSAKEPILTYTDKVKGKDVADDLDDAGYELADTVKVISNGTNEQEFSAADIKGNDNLGANGVKIEIYSTDGEKADLAVMTYTYVAKVTDVVEDDEDTKKDERALELEVYMQNGITMTVDVDSPDFEAVYGAVEKDDYILVTPKTDREDATEVLDMTVAETLTGVVEGYTKGSSITVDGEDYKYNKYCHIKDSTVANFTPTIKEEATFVLDTYGNIIAVAEANTASNDYVYVADFATEGSFSKTVIADAYFSDGTHEVVEVSRIDNDKVTSAPDSNGWYTYTEKDGTYRLNTVEATKGNAAVSNNGKVTENGKTTVTYNDGSDKTIRATNTTVFVVKGEDDVNVYTGIKNVPTITSKGQTVVTLVAKGNYATYVYVDLKNGDSDGATSSASDLIYILNKDYKTSVDGNENTYYTFDAVVNGKKTTVKLNDNGLADVTSGSDIVLALYGSVKYDEDGYVDSLKTVVDGSDYVVANADNAKVTYSDGVLLIDGVKDLVLADNCTIRTIDGTTVKTVSADRLANTYKDGGLNASITAVLDDDGLVTDLYIAL